MNLTDIITFVMYHKHYFYLYCRSRMNYKNLINYIIEHDIIEYIHTISLFSSCSKRQGYKFIPKCLYSH